MVNAAGLHNNRERQWNRQEEGARNYDETIWRWFKQQSLDSSQESALFSVVAAIAQKFFSEYAAGLVGFTVAFFALRLICNTCLDPDEKYSMIVSCKTIHKQYPWAPWLILVLATAFLSPEYAQSAIWENPAFWVGGAVGGFVSLTYEKQ